MNRLNNSFISIFVLLALTLMFFSINIPDVFWTVDNFQSIASQIPVLGILTLAMAVSMITGGINLSIIATMNSCSLVMAYFITQEYGSDSLILLIFSGILTALFIGILNGFLIAIIKVSPILATLGTMTLLNGLNILISKGSVISGFPKFLLNIEHDRFLSIPIPMIIFILSALMAYVVLEKMVIGKTIFAIGNNENAALFSGINTNKVLIIVYILSSVFCFIAAILMMAKLDSAKASYGSSYLLTSILAVVLGGINPDGGKGKILGIILALCLLQTLESGLNIMGVSSYITMALWGGLLILFIFIQRIDIKELIK